ncbi:ubiquitin-like protein 7 isoform X2 [Homalodisca vitripennis]|uniref:ubiquitin-like protein 7 isoform X2 n=1 Tax=Homalodisca vitripennis TaxID=197043 RepID=UPI001EEC9099|nr:ubiquitin-like protein 7 isoform X2 [Homalodisca vitripennis]
MTSLVLGMRLSLFDFQRVKVDDVDLHTKVEHFKVEVSKKANVPKESLELVYCGNILDDDSTLNACGIKSGVMIHVLKKKAKEIPKPTQTMSEIDIQSLVMAFRALTMNPSYRSSLQKLSRPDILDNIILITPGLSQDPVAISMIQDPELLVRMGDIDTVRRIVELHPALAEAANHIAAAVHEEAIAAPTSTQPTTSSGYSYSLDALSDDDEMDSSQSSDSQPVGARHAITADQLASALASASSPSPGVNQDSPGITSEMFSQAMQRAIASVVAQPNTGEASSEAAPAQGPTQLAQQMQQMRELGLTDDAVNLQALQLAQGNLHAAVDLVFSGAISPP